MPDYCQVFRVYFDPAAELMTVEGNTATLRTPHENKQTSTHKLKELLLLSTDADGSERGTGVTHHQLLAYSVTPSPLYDAHRRRPARL